MSSWRDTELSKR